MRFFVGTYTRGTAADGIYHLVLDADLRQEALLLATEADNPSWLARHPVAEVVYAVNEVPDYSGEGGAVSAFRATASGMLELASQVPSLGKDPCHLSVLDSGEALICSNYTSGTVTSYPLDAAGLPGDFESYIQHRGSGPDPMRQQSAHAHSSIATDRYLFVADLGSDQIIRYPLESRGSLDVSGMKRVRLTPGAGPRHMALDSGKEYLYAICELDNTIVSFAIADTLIELASYSTLPEGYTDASYTAQILMSGDDRFIYGSNRGHDSIVVFESSGEGELELVQHIGAGGIHPRHFVLTEDESHLMVANRDSDNLAVFSRNGKTGLLEDIGLRIEIPAPVCVLPC